MFYRDFRFAVRQLLKNPGFSLVAICTLALGIGANTAIFSVINAVLLRPLPYPEAERIVYVTQTAPGQPDIALSFPDAVDYQRDNTVFEHFAITRSFESRNLSGIPGKQPEQISSAFVTANFFKVIGIAPQLGRTFTAEEEKPGGPLAVIISDRLWTRVLQRDPNIIGRTLIFHDRPTTIVGVMPPSMNAPQNTDAWFSLIRRSAVPGWQNRANHPMMFGWGRLKAGVTVEEAGSQMKALAARLEQIYPESNKGIGVKVTPLLENLVGKYRTNLTLLFSAVGLVLLIACANLANLFAARGASRAREFAIRAAIGATRGQIVRQLLIESLTIAVIGGAFGLLLAVWGRDALISLSPQGAPRFAEIKFDPGVLAFTFGIAAFTSVLFGLWPAWRVSRVDVQPALQAGSHGSSETPAARRTRDWLVIIEVALTLILLSAAGLILKSFARMQSLSLGFEPRGVLSARIELPANRYLEREKFLPFANSLLEKVRALPGVQSAAIAANPPLLNGWQINFAREGAPEVDPSQQPAAETEVVIGDYFQTLKASLLRGRTFTEQDNQTAPPVVIISQSLAEQFFPGEDPVGKRLIMDPDGENVGNRSFEIIGVLSRLKLGGFADTNPAPAVYFAQAQVLRVNVVLLVRAAGNLKALERPIREIVTSIDPAQPIFDVRTMEERVAETWAAHRLLTFLLSVFAGLALLLAAVGLYGVLAYTAVKRLREIAVRLALGARPGQIRGLIIGHGMRLLLIGAVVGIAGAIAFSRVLQTFLFEVQALDPQIYLVVGTLLFVAAFMAAWLPARRAAHVDPMRLLRDG